MSRATRYLACGFLLAWSGVAAALAGLAAGLAEFAGFAARVGVVPDGVWLAVPVGCCAALLQVVHLRRTGILRAIAVGGARPARLASGVAIAAILTGVLLAVALPGEVGGGDAREAPLRPRVGLDGSLALGERFTWWADEAAPRAVDPGGRFVDRPRRPGHFRIRLLLARPPWAPTDHPLDPTAWRWVLWALAGVGLPWWLCARALAGRFGWG